MKIEQKPPEAKFGEDVWYRGWEAGQDDMAMKYTEESWIAYKGGCDLGAPKIRAKSWAELLEMIDDEEGVPS